MTLVQSECHSDPVLLTGDIENQHACVHMEHAVCSTVRATFEIDVKLRSWFYGQMTGTTHLTVVLISI